MSANESTFGQLTVGQKYTLLDGDDTTTIWMKIKTQTKGCCRNKRVIATSRNTIDASKTAIHNPKDRVCIVS